MTNVLVNNLAAMTVASTGTGTITLGSAARINGVLYLSFAAAGVSNGDTVAYSILDPAGAAEVGFGVYTSSGTTLTRNPTTSTNANAAINMSAAAIVRISPRLQDIGTPGQRPGTVLADTATSGNVGELVSSNIAAGSAISLTSPTPANVSSINVPTGRWRITQTSTFNFGTATNATDLISSMSQTSGTPDTTTGGAYGKLLGSYTGTGTLMTVNAGPLYVQFAAPTTMFHVVRGIFTISTIVAYGIIQAERMG